MRADHAHARLGIADRRACRARPAPPAPRPCRGCAATPRRCPSADRGRAAGRYSPPDARGGTRRGRNGRCRSPIGRAWRGRGDARRAARPASRATAASQRHAALPDRDLALAVALGRGLRARGDRADPVEQRRLRRRRSPSSSTAPASKSIQPGLRAARSLFDAIFTVGTGKPSGVPRPVVNRITVAPAAASAVDDTASLPGASSSVSPSRRDALAIADHVGDRRAPGLLHRAERLFLQRGDPAGDVAGGGVLRHRLAVVEEIALEAVDHADDRVEHVARRRRGPSASARRRTSRGSRSGSTRPPGAGDAVADPPDQRVGGQPRQPVRPAAFHAEHQLVERAPSSRCAAPPARPVRRPARQPSSTSSPLVCAVSVRIAGRRHSGIVGEQRGDLVLLAAQPDDQHAAGIGMAGEAGEDRARAVEVVAELRAADAGA